MRCVTTPLRIIFEVLTLLFFRDRYFCVFGYVPPRESDSNWVGAEYIFVTEEGATVTIIISIIIITITIITIIITYYFPIGPATATSILKWRQR